MAGKVPICLLIAAAVAGSTAAAVAATKLKVQVEEPVVPELMGGCSLKCAFRWTAELLPRAGGKAQPVRQLNDESAETAWIAEAPGGKGVPRVKLRLAFPKKLPAGMESQIPIYGLDLINGHWQSEELWAQHGRVKKARLIYNAKALGEVVFADSRRWQRVIFDDIMIRSGDSLTLEILEIYPGNKTGVAISEIVLQGGH